MIVDRRSFLKTSVTLLAGSAVGCASAQRSTSALRNDADALLRRSVQSGEIPGVVAAGTDRAEQLYEPSFGERFLVQGVATTPDTVVSLASMPTPWVGTATCHLEVHGELAIT